MKIAGFTTAIPKLYWSNIRSPGPVRNRPVLKGAKISSDLRSGVALGPLESRKLHFFSSLLLFNSPNADIMYDK